MIDARAGTLLMVGRATDAIVLGADSAGTWKNGDVESCQKIYPIGHCGPETDSLVFKFASVFSKSISRGYIIRIMGTQSPGRGLDSAWPHPSKSLFAWSLSSSVRWF